MRFPASLVWPGPTRIDPPPCRRSRWRWGALTAPPAAAAACSPGCSCRATWGTRGSPGCRRQRTPPSRWGPPGREGAPSAGRRPFISWQGGVFYVAMSGDVFQDKCLLLILVFSSCDGGTETKEGARSGRLEGGEGDRAPGRVLGYVVRSLCQTRGFLLIFSSPSCFHGQPQNWTVPPPPSPPPPPDDVGVADRRRGLRHHISPDLTHGWGYRGGNVRTINSKIVEADDAASQGCGLGPPGLWLEGKS